MAAATEPRDQDVSDVRCGCGSLLARQVEGGIELKCRRCRRRILLSPQTDGSVRISEMAGDS